MQRPSLKRTAFAVGYLAVFAFVAWFGYQSHAKLRTTAQMAEAANKWLASLSPEQKAKAIIKFEDENRQDWTYVPRERKGLPLKEMNEEQRKLAHAFLQTGLSAYGYKKVTDIMSLEPVLYELEGVNRKWPRDETLYFVTIYGTPGAKDKWGWRYEGHHISLNFTIVKGELLSDAPLGLGTNPAEVRQGPRTGFRAQANEEDKGRAMILALDEKQRATAIFEKTAPGDIFTLGKLKADPLDPKGIGYNQLNAKQQAQLLGLIDEYLARVPDEVAKQRREKMQKAGLGTIYFGWAGGLNKGDGHYYRIQSKTLLIEYDDTQNNNNHIHTVWRDFNGDFGRDFLQEHYQSTSHSTSQVTNQPSSQVNGPIYDASDVSITKPQAVSLDKGSLTPEAKRAGITGAVVLSVVFTAEGAIVVDKVIQGLSHGLSEEAIRAAQNSRFTPGLKDGKPVNVRAKMEFNFH